MEDRVEEKIYYKAQEKDSNETIEKSIKNTEADNNSEFVVFLEGIEGRLYRDDFHTFYNYIGKLKNDELAKIINKILVKVLALHLDLKVRAFHEWLEVRYRVISEGALGTYVFGIKCKKNDYRLAFKPTDINTHPIDMEFISKDIVDGPWRVLDCGNYPEGRIDELVEVAKRSFLATVNP